MAKIGDTMNNSVISEQLQQNPAGWPNTVLALFERAITCEYATLTKHQTPITYPVTPYIGDDGRTLDVSTGLTYPAKAERARRNPKVALLYSDPVGSGLANPPVVLVLGLATVQDANLQQNTDRYLRLSMVKVPSAYKGMPPFMLRRMPWYFGRIWIQVTPLRILWWPAGETESQPQIWQAPTGTAAPPSDPAPSGKALGVWKEGPTDWRSGAEYAVQNLGDPILTIVTADGFPLPFRVRNATLVPGGIRIHVPSGRPAPATGPACLTFHTHPELFTGQQNLVFVGQVQQEADGCIFSVERQLGDWSLVGSRLKATWDFMQNGRKLAPRLAAEAERRGQPVPKVRLPGEY
jgi:hypothetical protein